MNRTLADTLNAFQGDFTVGTVTGRPDFGGAIHTEGSGSVPQEDFLEAMRKVASGVALVTTTVDGRPWGLTVSSFCSLTLEPPQVLVSLQTSTASCQRILQDERFGASILGEDQEELARLGAATGVAKFVDNYCEEVDVGTDSTCESPAVAGALCHLDCVLTQSIEICSHTVLVGLVTGAVVGDPEGERQPLLYADRQFARPQALQAE